MSRPVDERPFIVDLVIAVCNGCQSERKFPIDPPFRSAQEFIAREEQKLIPPCTCGHRTADLKLRIAESN